MDWRKTDTRYAVATAAALGLVAYLVASNFGLVPNPLVGPRGDALTPRAFVPAVAGENGGPGGTPLGTTGDGTNPLIGAVLGEGSTAPDRDIPGPVTPPADTTRPSSRFVTPDDSVVGLNPVEGVSTDAASGIDRVVVTFELLGVTSEDIEAELVDCTPDRRRCRWEANPPLIAGTWSVTATATDRAGNVEQDPPQIFVVVVTTQTGTSAITEDDGGLIDNTVDTLGGAVGTVVGLVGGLL